MLIEVSSTECPTAWEYMPRPFSTGPGPNRSVSPPRLEENGTESFATSLDAMNLRWKMRRVWLGVFLLTRAISSAVELEAYRSLFLVVRDKSREQKRFEGRLRAAFAADPLEDGMDHPAEEIIVEVLQSVDKGLALEWFRVLVMDFASPSVSASVLRCLGRQEELGTAVWRTQLVRDALAMDDVQMRDAAAQAAESWGDQEMRAVLQAHTETVPWLGDYINEVVNDLAE